MNAPESNPAWMAGEVEHKESPEGNIGPQATVSVKIPAAKRADKETQKAKFTS